jgi:hypothetical protein
MLALLPAYTEGEGCEVGSAVDFELDNGVLCVLTALRSESRVRMLTHMINAIRPSTERQPILEVDEDFSDFGAAADLEDKGAASGRLGRPQCGQASASVLSFPPQSGH